MVSPSQCLIKLTETVSHCDGGVFSGAASPVGGRLYDFVRLVAEMYPAQNVALASWVPATGDNSLV
jgi:hypothetical protein